MTGRWLPPALALLACGPANRTPDGAPPDAAATPAAPTPPVDPTTPAPPACADEPGMVYIAGGDYPLRVERKTVTIAPFWIDRTEATVGAFRPFVAAGHDTPYRSDSKQVPLACTWELADNDKLPVTCLDWYQCDAFCLWQGKRLPTAHEWGWAAQGRDQLRKQPWGDEPPSCERAVVDMDRTDDVTGCGRNAPWPVGSMPGDVTRDGVLDMAGNVSEATSSGATEDERSSRLFLGATWASAASKTFNVAEAGSFAVHRAYSDKGGVRCVKPAGPLPPCKPPA